jgi:hypothetical protein
MSRARDLSRLTNPVNFTVDTTNNRIGLNSTSPTAELNVAGIVSATEFYGDGSNLEGVASAGLGTALGETDPLAVIYFTDQQLNVNSSTQITVPDSSDVAYTQYSEIVVDDSNDLIINDGDDFVPDILGLSTTGMSAPAGAGNDVFNTVYADFIEDKAGRSAPTFNHGANVTGVVTATRFVGDASGLTGDGSGLTNIVGSGSGIVVKNNGSSVGTAGTINFSTNLDVSAISAGVVTVTSSNSRTNVSGTTGSVGAAATTNLNITAFKSYGLLKVGISSAAWVRLYVDAASRTSDATRSYLTDPVPGSGLIAEVRTETAGVSTFSMTPGVIGWNNDTTPATTVYAAVTNNESSAAAITVTLTVVKMED